MANVNEIGGIEFERDLNKVDPALSKREPYSENESDTGEDNLESQPGKSQPDGRQTDPASDFEREQQPVVNHQDRRHK